MTKDRSPVEGPPEKGSDALLSYFWASSCDLGLFHLVIDTVIMSDYTAFVAQKALDGEYDYKELDPGDLADQDPGPRTKALRRSSQELLEMFLSRAVDNFQVYLVDVVRNVLRQRPEILSATRKEFALSYILPELSD